MAESHLQRGLTHSLPTLQVTVCTGSSVCKQTGDFSLFGVWAKNIHREQNHLYRTVIIKVIMRLLSTKFLLLLSFALCLIQE